MSAVKVAIASMVLAAGCLDDRLAYNWDDRQVLCSDSIDSLHEGMSWGLIDDALRDARDERRVALFHAHAPGVTITLQDVEDVLEIADRDHLEFVTYRDLVPGPRRGGLALAFDDNNVESWLSIRDVLAAHDAHVTFFVSRYELLTDDERAGIAQLAADGHDIEPHSVRHLHAPQYVREHGLVHYMADEALPSMQVLEDAGYTPTAYAYPFGTHTAALDEALLAHVAHVRVSPGSCPY